MNERNFLPVDKISLLRGSLCEKGGHQVYQKRDIREIK